MRNRRTSSSTAEGAAAARAYGAMCPDERLRNPDHLAGRFVGGFFRFVLLPGIRRRFLVEYERRAPGAFFLHQARTKHIDARLLSEVEGGASQIVFLGAGYDTRAYRFADRLKKTRVFEVDHPATSAMKQRRVRRILGASPPHVTYVPVNFTQQTVEDRLGAAGYDPSRRTLFVWEGVSVYLDRPAVDATFALVGRAAPGSSIVFDYMHESALLHPDESAKTHMATAAKLGEPYTFGVEPDQLAALVAPHGLAIDENLSAADLESRYLIAKDGTCWGKISPFYALATARRAAS